MTRRLPTGEFDLDTTITETYFGLRWLMVAMATALPLLLWWGGELVHQIPLQASMSAYYYTDMRDWFVGILVAVGACLFLYKGLSDKESYLLNAAAVFAVGVAVNPMDWTPSWWFLPAGFFTPHGICAVLFFLMIALACWLCQDDSLNLGLVPPQDQAAYRAKYSAIGVALLVLPLLAVAFGVIGQPFKQSLFCAEALAIWVFAFYWYTKSGELKKAMEAQVGKRGPTRRSA
jgi:hypothetical protein